MDFLKPESWPRAPGFSWGTSASGRTVFVAGQVGRNIETGEMADGFAAQTARLRPGTVLTSGGAQPEHVAHMTWYVTDIDAYKAAGRDIGAAYKETFGKHFPAMTMVQVVGLIDSKALLEIECFAVVPE